jgi:hypothetical protein
LLLLQTLPAPHSASSWQSCAAPAAQAASHVAVVPLPAALGARQQTCVPAQLSSLEQAALLVVPAGQAAVEAAQLNVLLLLLFMPPPPAPGTVQQVGLGATQKLPAPPQATAPVCPRFTGAVMSRLGSSPTTMGAPSPAAPVTPVLPDVPAAPGRSELVALVPAAPGSPLSASLLELPHAAAMAADTKTTPTETLERTREYFILADLF